MKVGRYLLLVLVGGIIGGIIDLSFGIFENNGHFSSISFASHEITIIVCLIASLINIILTLVLYKVQKNALTFKSKMNHDIEGQQADEFEEKANMMFMRTSFIYYVQILISLICMLIIVMVNASEGDIFYPIIPYLITIIPSLMIGFFVRKFDSRYPKQGEAQYTEKILDIMDEGERHITLVSMFKIYHINLTLLIIGGMTLGLFSLITGINQLLGLLLIIILFIYNAFGYMLKVRKFYL